MRLLNALGRLGPQTAARLARVTKVAGVIVSKTLEDLIAWRLVSVLAGPDPSPRMSRLA
jgi:hypothetical protein